MKIQTPNFSYLKASFYSCVIREILNDAVVGSFMSSLILSLCCIDYMSVPLANNNRNTRRHFKKFINDYMAAANIKYSEQRIQDIIYSIRCSLVHVFGESDAIANLNIDPVFGISESNENHLMEYLNEHNQNSFYLSIPHFIGDVIAAVEKFFRETSDIDILSGWYKKLIILSGVSGPLNLLATVKDDNVIYPNIHSYLEVLNDNTSTYNEISNYIANKILSKHNYI